MVWSNYIEQSQILDRAESEIRQKNRRFRAPRGRLMSDTENLFHTAAAPLHFLLDSYYFVIYTF